MHCVRSSYKSRGSRRVMNMSHSATSLFIEDFHPDYRVANGKNFHAIAASLFKQLQSDPGPRSFSTKRFKSLEKRFQEDDFPCFFPSRLPHDGDMWRVYFELLLEALPLETITLVPHKNGIPSLPNSTKPENFHRNHWRLFQTALGVTPSLQNIRQFTIEYFKRRCPPDRDNDFKWPDFKFTEADLDARVTYATYEFGEACLDRSAVQRRSL